MGEPHLMLFTLQLTRGAAAQTAARRPSGRPTWGGAGRREKKWDRGSGSSSAHTESAAPRSAQPRRAKTHKTFHSIKCYTRRPAPTPFQRQTRAPPRRRHGNGEGQFFMHPSASPRPSPRSESILFSPPRLAWPRAAQAHQPPFPTSLPKALGGQASDDTHSP